MPISKNILLQQTSGTLGKQVVIKNYGGKIVLSDYPDMSERVLSPKQLAANELMREANEEAKEIMKDPIKKKEAGGRLRVPDNKLYRALIKEYLLNNKVPNNVPREISDAINTASRGT